ncbi:sperm-tail PG-rich repeat-containing 2-like [Histomonas meleagridis]|uniref:sperm-tail PG-rich repeat-containing 2-like n=1 Tax=Histomonas meleagridis TaxID=135588 RepID=UPI0035598121|nr:sperm-tail PG-rich repeat-containing 2-like [Histomonas meleagridis]KAH0801201.1 sperm-tail PG-rich repeat-containing 2-like [Histomonas meleagridis]
MSSTTPENVGPGSYDLDVHFKRYRKPIPFGSTTRRELFPNINENSNIDPGTYNPIIPNRSRSAQSIFKSHSKREYFQEYAQNPGPADYSSLCVWGKKHPSMQKRNISFTKKEEEPTPGPGSYSPHLPQNKNAYPFSLSRSPQREVMVYNGIPGPGRYYNESPQHKQTESPAFRNKQTRTIFKSEVNDSYMLEHTAWNIESPSNRPFGGLSKRDFNLGNTETDSNVGPGRYSPKEISKPKINRSQFSTDRSTIFDVNDSNPGPGYYYDSEPQQPNHGLVIPREKRGELWNIQRTPSPGQYETNVADEMEKEHKNRIPNPAFKSKEARDCYQISDGPGPKYNIESSNSKKHQTPTFPRSKRFGDDRTDVPSPDSYMVHPNQRKSIGGYITKGKRFAERKKSWVPSPDAYQNGNKCNLIHQSANVNFQTGKKHT